MEKDPRGSFFFLAPCVGQRTEGVGRDGRAAHRHCLARPHSRTGAVGRFAWSNVDQRDRGHLTGKFARGGVQPVCLRNDEQGSAFSRHPAAARSTADPIGCDMKRSSTRSDIFSAECQLAQSKRASRESFAQVRSAVHSRLAQPSSLLMATGLGALLGVWFARRSKPRVKHEGVSAWAPIVGLASTYLIRFAMQRLADTWVRVNTSDPQHSATENSVMRDNPG